jgi:hypothetical protein
VTPLQARYCAPGSRANGPQNLSVSRAWFVEIAILHGVSDPGFLQAWRVPVSIAGKLVTRQGSRRIAEPPRPPVPKVRSTTAPVTFARARPVLDKERSA